MGLLKQSNVYALKELKLGFSDTVFEEEGNPQSEITVISDVMTGPLECGMDGCQRNVPNYWKIKKYIGAASKSDRVSCENRYICDKYKDC